MSSSQGRRSQDGPSRPSYLWDYDLDEDGLRALLAGQSTIGHLDQDWAAVRVLEYAPFEDIVRLLGFDRLVHGWSHWRQSNRSDSRRRGLDFVAWWLRTERPDLLRA